MLDLHELTDEQIAMRRVHSQTKVALLLLKHGRDRGLREFLCDWCGLLGKVLRSRGGHRAFRLCVRYILRVSRVKADDLVDDMAPVLGRRAGEIIMTEAERLMALGEKRGILLGEKRGEKRGLQRGLAPIVRLFERKLDRPLTETERQALHVRLDTHGPDRLGDVVLDLASQELAAWLADPNAT